MELGDLDASPSKPAGSPPAGQAREAEASEQAKQVRSTTGLGVSQDRGGEGKEQRTAGESVESRPSEADQVRPLPAPLNLSMPPMVRTKSEAIGEATDLPTPMLHAPASDQAGGAIVQFTLLLASTGTRHPFQLNEKYLNKRNVTARKEDGTFDPSAMSVYTLKELILKDWREDWDQKPASPSAIRLIYFGQLLADNVSLKECKLQTGGASNVVHVSVKPQEVMDDEEAGKGKQGISSDQDPSDRGAGCRCVIL